MQKADKHVCHFSGGVTLLLTSSMTPVQAQRETVIMATTTSTQDFRIARCPSSGL